MRWLLSLYPRVWRDRYEEEVLAVLEEHSVTSATVVDLLMGAVDAHLNYNGLTEGVSAMVNRIKSGVVMAFCAFMLFGVGWSLLQRLTDPMRNFQAVDSVYPGFGVLFNAVFLVGCLSFLAFLVGGLPVFFISVRRAIKNKQHEVLAPFRLAVLCLFVFVAMTAMIGIFHPQHFVYMYLIGYLTLSALLLIIGTVAVSLVVARTEFQLSELKLVYIPEIVIVFCMVVSVVLSTTLIIAVTAHAPQLFHTQDVSSQMFIVGLVFMALGTIFAAMGLKRGMVRGWDQLTQV